MVRACLLLGFAAMATAATLGAAETPNAIPEREHVQSFAGPIGAWDAVGPVVNVSNNGPRPGYGSRLDYYSRADQHGFDLANADLAVARAPAPNGTSYLAHWFVQVSPLDSTHLWQATIAEMNPVNRGDDPGWTDNLASLPRLTGGLRIVPETGAFGEPGFGRNVEFGYAVAANGHPNALGEKPATYNGFMIEANSIAANGRGVLAMGASAPAPEKQLPETALEIRAHWRQGLTTVGGEFASGDAIHIGTGQAIALTDAGDVVLKTDPKGRRIQILGHGKRLMSLDLGTGDLYVAGRIVEHGQEPP